MSSLEGLVRRFVDDPDLAFLIANEVAANFDDYMASIDLMEAEIIPLMKGLTNPTVICWQIQEELLEHKDSYAADMERLKSGEPSEQEEQAEGVDEDDEALVKELGKTRCEMCQREMPLTFHHLFPKKLHKSLKSKSASSESRGVPKSELKSCGIMICRPCHSMLHRTFDHATLASELCSINKILGNETVREWVNWAAKQKSYDKKHAKLGLKYSK